MDVQDLETLGRLTALCCLYISSEISLSYVIVGGDGLFQNLRHCTTNLEFVFRQGAMPMLAHLEFRVSVLGLCGREDPAGLGLGHLPFLERIVIYLQCSDASSPEVEQMEAMLTNEVHQHESASGGDMNLISLQQLRLHSANKFPSAIAELDKLVELRVIEIQFCKMDQNSRRSLVESMCNLRNIQVLKTYIVAIPGQQLGRLGAPSTAPPVLAKNHLSDMTTITPGRLPMLCCFYSGIPLSYVIAGGDGLFQI
uniref:Disease resistance R13L4/SHOC-2-like LRR domain-containing protein n=1 Tax=Oryza meridionalis TaxID=40149 RepID=A0A0E0F8V9_9ORYZ